MVEKKTQIDAIMTATNEVFTTMLSAEPAAGEAYTDRNAGSVAEGVVALIGLTGPWIGNGMVTCGAPLACKLSSLLLMGDPAEQGEAVNEEVLDAVAEITNMIIGNVKNILEEHLGELNLSTPTVVYGRNLTTRSTHDSEWVVVPFDCNGERLEVKLCLAPNTTRNIGRPGFGLSHVLNALVQ